MEIIYCINIICSSGPGRSIHAMLMKRYESNIIPSDGIFFEDLAWKEPKRATSIICNLNEDHYLLQFEDVEKADKDQCEREEKMYRIHGWKSPG